MKTKTYSAGANDERTAIIAKVRRMTKKSIVIDGQKLLDWLLTRDERCNKRKGGIGK